MFTKKAFGQRLRQLRKEHNEYQDTLADLLEVSTAQISEMENGKKGTTLERLVTLCRHYNVSADYLLGLSDTPSNPVISNQSEDW